MAEMGRPPEYSAEILAKAKTYIAACEEEYIVKLRPAISKAGKVKEEAYVAYDPKIPTLEGLANFIGHHRDTLYEWEEKYPDFSDVMGELRQKQADKLINNGLAGRYNPTIAKVLLTKHGYREGQEHSGPDGQSLFDEKEAKDKGKAAIGSFLNSGDPGQGKQS